MYSNFWSLEIGQGATCGWKLGIKAKPLKASVTLQSCILQYFYHCSNKPVPLSCCWLFSFHRRGGWWEMCTRPPWQLLNTIQCRPDDIKKYIKGATQHCEMYPSLYSVKHWVMKLPWNTIDRADMRMTFVLQPWLLYVHKHFTKHSINLHQSRLRQPPTHTRTHTRKTWVKGQTSTHVTSHYFQPNFQAVSHVSCGAECVRMKYEYGRDRIHTHAHTHSLKCLASHNPHPNQLEIICREVTDIQQPDPTHPHVLFMMTFPPAHTHTHTLAESRLSRRRNIDFHSFTEGRFPAVTKQVGKF